MKDRRAAHLYLCGLIGIGVAIGPLNGWSEERQTLTMELAVELALERNLELRASQIDVELAEAEQIGARTLPSNPELGGGAGIRLGPDGQSVEAGASLGHSFALGRPRRQRIAAAAIGRDAAENRFEFQRLRVAARARIAFVLAVTSKQITDLARETEALTRSLHSIAEERLDADAGTGLEVNLAALEWSQARRSLIKAVREEMGARNELMRVLSSPPNQALTLPTELPSFDPITTSEEELLELALEGRPDLTAFENERGRARSMLAVARADAFPELTIEASYDFEEGQDHIIGMGLSMPLPLFQRNQGAIARERAHVALVDIEAEAAQLAVFREVLAAIQRYEAAREIAEVAGQETIERSADNLELLRASFEEGNVGFVEVLLVQRELLAARRDAITATAEHFRARIELELAVGNEVR